MNMNKMLQQAQKIQKDMEKQQKELESKVFSEKSNGIEINSYGTKKIESIRIDPEIIDLEDIEMFEDLMRVAINKVNEKIDTETESKMSKFTQGMGGGFPF